MAWKNYKSGQGTHTRRISAFTAGGIAALGCYRLYVKLGSLNLENANTNLLIQILVPLAVLIGFSWLIYWLYNKPVIADFLIAGEGEMKKVSWSSRKEITASTIVVIVVVFLMSTLMATADFAFQVFFRMLHVLQ